MSERPEGFVVIDGLDIVEPEGREAPNIPRTGAPKLPRIGADHHDEFLGYKTKILLAFDKCKETLTFEPGSHFAASDILLREALSSLMKMTLCVRDEQATTGSDVPRCLMTRLLALEDQILEESGRLQDSCGKPSYNHIIHRHVILEIMALNCARLTLWTQRSNADNYRVLRNPGAERSENLLEDGDLLVVGMKDGLAALKQSLENYVPPPLGHLKERRRRKRVLAVLQRLNEPVDDCNCYSCNERRLEIHRERQEEAIPGILPSLRALFSPIVRF
ncbi:hypothetical protein N7462_005463 [Penicillium macrosclerotiorum]|uniref:uncharacterized protein n=1 Tax=Penicillium macrosclerotiorum TaxID=303699 RepID=UPI002546F43A|nr:uncharacterized protein N7462_005463 [Penicillium macrosclerotiorum]KAJ5682298.1 hypothetical protein N7462_005463 [Penicillium macrosclerotiorum]